MKLNERFPTGTRVTVTEAYVGSGRYAPDGNEGAWFVVGHVEPSDLKLARVRGAPWQVICHLSRIAEAKG